MLLVANASLSCSSSTWFRRFLNNGANIERYLGGSALPDPIWELTSFDYARHAARDGPVVIAGPPLSSLSAGEHGEWVDGLFSYLLTVEADSQFLQRRQPDGSGDLADYLRDIYCSRASDPRRISGRPVKCVQFLVRTGPRCSHETSFTLLAAMAATCCTRMARAHSPVTPPSPGRKSPSPARNVGWR